MKELVRKVVEMCLRVLKENRKSRFDRYSRQKHCIDHIPYYLSGLSRAHFSDNLSRKIAVYSLWNNNQVICNILSGLFEFINWMNSKKWTHFFNDKSGSLLYYWKFNTFYLFFFPSRTNNYKTFWFIFQHPWAISLKITVLFLCYF